jgi:RecA-family ATPase
MLIVLVELEVPKEKRSEMTEEQLNAKCEEFYRALLDSNLPLAAIYTSGGPSVHGLVDMFAKDRAEWDERMETVYKFCATMPGFDPSNKNPGRLSRLPGAFRDGQRQELLDWRVGAASFSEWHASIQTYSFEVEDLVSLVEENPPLPPILVENWLHKSNIASLTGSMKTNKSWTIMDLAIKLAMHGEWFGRRCGKSLDGKSWEPATVLYFDAEINRKFWQHRFRALCEAMRLDPLEVAKTRRILPVFLAGTRRDDRALVPRFGPQT